MSFVRAFAFGLLLSASPLACSQIEDGVLLERADASADNETAAASFASPAAREVLARLDSRLEASTNEPTSASNGLPPLLPKTSEKARSTVRFEREGALLKVDTEAPPQAHGASLALPLEANQPFRIADLQTGLSAQVALKGASEAEAEVVDGHLVYLRAAFGYGDIVHRPSALGTEDFILFDKAPPSERLEYEVGLGEKVAGLRLVENVLELLDETGAPRLRVAPPYVIDADGERHDAALSVEGCSVDTNPAAPWGRDPVAAGASSCTVVVDWKERKVGYPAVVDPSWETTGSMVAARAVHTASLLSTGHVLVAGGRNGTGSTSSYLNSAEVYDPATGTWGVTGSMSSRRETHTATVLDAKSILVIGGYYYESNVFGGTNWYLRSSEIYDTDSGTWSATGLLIAGRSRHSAVRLSDGKVLVVGGHAGASDSAFSSAELYDPVTKAFSSAGNMVSRRRDAEAVGLADGRVLIIGGYDRNPETWLSATEIFNPASMSFTSVAAIPGARAGHRATLRFDGRVVVYGGFDGSKYLGSGATYNPVSNSWSAIPSSTPRTRATMTALENGQILVAGGRNDAYPSSAEIYVPITNNWLTGGPMNRARSEHTATRLLSGDVLLAGGSDASSYLAASEIYKSPILQCADSSHCPNGPCVGGFCCDSACDGGCGRCDLQGFQGTCRPIVAGSAGSPSCSPYVCSGTSAACPTSCTSNADCIPSHVCSSGVCKAKATNGSGCSANGECQSGVCKGGFCCGSACTGECESCASGTCSFDVAGTPKAGCGYFVCNGQSGICPSSCTHDAQCRSDAFCDGGTCRPKTATGAACQKGGDCQSGFCTDGVCCESACDGQCAQCNRENALGSCVAIVGNPVGGRASCTSDGSVCGGRCDGERLDCSYPSAGSICAAPSCMDGVVRAEARCDGKGVCAVGESRHCAPYACGESDCKSVCESSSDCYGAAECVEGHCIGTLDPGASCLAGGECQSGYCADGVCCNEACDEECAACNVAGSMGICVLGAKPGCEADEVWMPEDSGGCGCRVAGESREGSAHLALGGLAVALTILRRGRRPPA